jgi:hypothetical protein
MEVDDESLDINIFEKLMEGKHTEIVSNGDDDLKASIILTLFLILNRRI